MRTVTVLAFATFFLALAFQVSVATIQPSVPLSAKPSADVMTAVVVVEEDTVQWQAGDREQKTFNATECDRLSIRTDGYQCAPAKPFVVCASDDQCAPGELCGEAMAPRLCVKCDMTKIIYTTYDYSDIMLNVTASMVAGKFWTTDDFYNHTGVDLILTLERWVWSPAMNALLHDGVTQHRSTWHDKYDADWFTTFTEAYDRYNATHVRFRSASTRRVAYDTLNGGETTVEASSSTAYLPTSV